MDVHGYTEDGSIDVTIDGVRMSVPDAPGNRHRRQIAEWEADGNTIPPWVPAPTDQPERQPSIIAQIRLSISDGIVTAASTDGGLSSCSVFEPGLMWCEFAAPVDGDYLVWPSDGDTHRCCSKLDEQFPEGFVVRTKTFTGDETFPDNLQILVTKS